MKQQHIYRNFFIIQVQIVKNMRVHLVNLIKDYFTSI